MDSDSDNENSASNKKIKGERGGKKALRAEITKEKEIRKKEQEMRNQKENKPKSQNDYERLLIAD